MIVNDDVLGKLPLKVVVPLTDCFQVRFVPEERFVKKIGEIDFEISESVKVALSKVFSIHI